MTKTPKGANNASDSKAVKANAVPLQRGRRSHDPNRALASLPAGALIDKVYNISDTKLMSKGFWVVLASMAGLTEKELPISPHEPNPYGRPVFHTFDQFVSWVKRLSMDNGFIVASLFGCTGSGKCISRGPYAGKHIHINSGGLTFVNKRGTHVLLCGTSSSNSAHAFTDLSDPFVKLISSALNFLEIISLDESSNNHDDDTVFQDDVTADPSYPLLVETLRLINPTIKLPSYHNNKTHGGSSNSNYDKKKPAKTYHASEDYYESMALPEVDEDDEQEEVEVKVDEAGNIIESDIVPTKVTGKKKNKITSVTLNQEIEDSEEDDDESDDGESDDY
jgi:hypothetical protein